jgi:hypothetical protein
MNIQLLLRHGQVLPDRFAMLFGFKRSILPRKHATPKEQQRLSL